MSLEMQIGGLLSKTWSLVASSRCMHSQRVPQRFRATTAVRAYHARLLPSKETGEARLHNLYLPVWMMRIKSFC